MLKKRLCYTFIIIFALFYSCTNRKNLVYFQGTLSGAETNKSYNPTLKPDDILSITVLGIDQESVKPFNIPVTNFNQNVGGYTQGAPTPPGYLIDQEGYIDFPVIGKIKVGGLTRVATSDLIKESLNPYFKDNPPTVLIRILNYKITILGEVKNPGTFTIPNERITLPEALGIAGDLLITGVRKEVIVIRDNDGKKTETKVDLTSKELFSSPVYYLQQNDLVYVAPNRAKVNSSVVNTSNVGIVISTISLFITLAVLFKR